MIKFIELHEVDQEEPLSTWININRITMMSECPALDKYEKPYTATYVYLDCGTCIFAKESMKDILELSQKELVCL